LLSPGNALLVARLCLAVMFLWFGAMNFTAVGTQITGSWIEGHAVLSSLAGQAGSAAKTLGVYQIIAGILIGAPIPSGSFRRIGFAMSGLYAALALTVLFTNPVWIEAAGGFPAIGSGQGILKYIAILGLSLWGGSFENSRMFAQRHTDMRLWSQPVMWLGLVLVLGWIGGMKFTAVEAAGIEPLVQTSPAFSWLLGLMSLQTLSNLIGMIELITVVGLIGYWFNTTLFRMGLYLAIFTFILTLSFLITFPGSWAGELGGFPALGRAGHFLLKDLPLLAVCLAMLSETGRQGTLSRR
jgi:reactive chlorine resistance protein C